MWLIVMMLAAVIATAIWYIYDDRRETYSLGVLALILWGTSIMVLVDHVMGYLAEGGEFLIVWEVVLLVRDPKGILKDVKRRS